MQFKVSKPNELTSEAFMAINKKSVNQNIYQNLASIVLTPCVIVGFWRGTWDLIDHHQQIFPVPPAFILSGFFIVIIEFIRNGSVSKKLNVSHNDTNAVALKKKILLSIFDVSSNFSNVVLWRSLWGQPEGKFFIVLRNLTSKFEPELAAFDTSN